MNFLNLLVSALLALANSNKSTIHEENALEWRNFKQLYGKTYENSELDAFRQSIFLDNKQKLKQIYSDHLSADKFRVELNSFADLTSHELELTRGLKLPKNSSTGQIELPNNTQEAEEFLNNILNDNSIPVPDELDWRKVPNRVTRVKNQNLCSSSWAFAATGALEGQEIIRSKLFNRTHIVKLSEQNLLDCVKNANGCSGGYMSDAMDLIQQEGGIVDDRSYPYEARAVQCRFNRKKVVFTDSGSAVLPEGDEENLKKIVAKFGPVSAGIQAGFLLHQYKDGIYINDHCGKRKEELDHAVLIVGYGTDSKAGDYWIIKNSWGLQWGENGFARIARNRGNMCGIATIATIPIF